MTRRLTALIAAFIMLVTTVAPTAAQVSPAAAAPATAGAAKPVSGQQTATPSGLPASATDESKVPHYFGPYSNWANSPQVLADAIVTISNGGGTGAEATATVNPKTGGISGVTITSPGSGYTSAPDVAITAAGVTPTATAAATATISQGVVTSVSVAEAGFGFTAPAVTLTGGNPTPGFEATAVASGGVDNVTITAPGSGYSIQPIVVFSMPDLPSGTQATGTATMDANGHVDGVSVVAPGSGYTSAPSVTIFDGGSTMANAVADPAIVVATIGIAQVDVTSGGQGYDSVPVVTIADTVGVADKGASAIAVVAVKGAVTDITVTAAGAGYLTPGIRKFVDTLAGLTPAGKNNLGNYIPVAVPDTTTYPGTDYYEIGVVQYRQKFHTDLPATLLRGYVQLSTSVVPGKKVVLTNANLDPAAADAPVLLPDGSPALGVDKPSYLGPTIIAAKDRPVRILFRDLLPIGVDGNLFLPVDTSLMGAGMGPDMVTLDANKVPKDLTQDNGSVLDAVRNPECGQIPTPMGCYEQNRATLHLHGGVTPWISDGTPHQWITPAPLWSGADKTSYPKGVSVSNVPDMPDPGPGAQTFFYTNQQSARLMFYHDHAWGITRLNVYAGEAAGYVITDATEQALIAPGGALAGLGVGTPLVIQDKTFVPDTIADTDPTWDKSRWGGTGSLWTPHVYMPAQNPSSPTGTSMFGRWMYGPWFWPPAKNAKYPPIANPYYDPACDLAVPSTWQYQTDPYCEPQQIPSTPNISVGMEAFNDTPIVNGTAYPTTTVDPKAYRYRILNAANDRFWNLQWYVADPTTGTLSEVALKPAEVAAAQTDPNVFPTPDTTKSPAGPSWIQIGTEGGFLPTPVVVPNQPITWITDPTRFDFGNVDQHSLLLAPAERADVIVDFSAYRGKTLILYNDAPAAFPARVSSYDYYTGGPNLSPVGAPTTLPGYGPNTRTIMQVKVSNGTPEVAFDRPNTTSDRMGTLMAAFAHHLDANGKPAGVFESGSDPIIVGQAAYNAAYGTSFAATGWCGSPTKPTAKCDGYARIAEGSQPTDTFKFDTLSGNKLAIQFQPKGMHDEANSASFDEWGRMSANLGLEAPGATPIAQNIILYPYVNPATEILDSTGLPTGLHVTQISTSADGTQIWKITHNGVDTHPIHWHLFDVQLINRVTWDGIIIPPDPTELGWKDTVRVSPLEDTIVALRPIVPTLPFAVPDSRRPLNPMMPIGARGDLNTLNGQQAGFNNTDTNGNPLVTPISNDVTDFNWEYVFHCHILSHEEMDMMRPMTVKVDWTVPDAPVLTHQPAGPIVLDWTDGTPVNYTDPSTWGHPKDEIGYKVLRATVTGGVPGAFAEVGHGLANQVTWTDPTAEPGVDYQYQVVSYNEAGEAASNTVDARVGLTVTASSVTVAYGDPIPSIVPSFNPVAPAPATQPTCTTDYTTISPVGTYASTCSGITTPDPTYLSAIYYVAGTVTVVPANVTVTGPTVNLVYGAPAPATLVPTYSPNLVPASPATCTSAYAAGSPVGTYPVTCTVAPDPNFVFTLVNGSIIVGTAPLTVTGPTLSLTYGDPVPATLTPTYLPDIAPANPATCSTTYTAGSPVGTYPVTCSATDPNYAYTFLPGSITVGPAALTITASSGTMVYGGTVPTITAGYKGLVAPDSAPATPPTCSTAATPTSPVGSYPSTCTGAVDANYTITLVPGTVTVTPASQAITFGPLPNISWGAPAFSLVATASSGLPVSFAATTPATCSVTGTAVSLVSPGLCTIVASQAGNASYPPATPVSRSFTIAKAVSVGAITTPFDPTKLGAPVTFNVAVTAAVAAAGIPSGTIQLVVDGVNNGAPVALDASGHVSIVLSTLALGTHAVTFAYAGDTLFLGSTSAPLAHTIVTRLSTTTAVTSSVNPSTVGRAVVFTATVTPQNASLGVAPSGTVQFTLDGANLGAPVTLGVNGQARIAAPAMAVGTHTVRATYGGDTNFTTSRSALLTQTVIRIGTVTTVSLVTPVRRTTTIRYTAKVAPLAAGAGTPTGTVRFYRGATLIGSATLTGGVATLNYRNTRLRTGTYAISARYIGSGTYLTSTSAAVSQRIQP